MPALSPLSAKRGLNRFESKASLVKCRRLRTCCGCGDWGRVWREPPESSQTRLCRVS